MRSLVDNRGTLFVTGAAGFLGQEAVRRAQAAGIRVRATDRRRGDLPEDVDFRPADICVPETLRGLFQGVDCLVHVAGLAHLFDKSQARTAPFREVNAEGAAHVAQAAAHAGVRAMVLVSSVAVYGSHDGQVVDERSPCRPEGPYAQSKYEAEQRVTTIAEQAGMRLTILRLATLYGEQDPGNVLRLFRAIDRRRFIWIGTGANKKSLIHRDDAARACIAAALGRRAGVYNVSASPYTLREIVEAIADALTCRLPRWHIPPPTGLELERSGRRGNAWPRADAQPPQHPP